MLTSWCILEGVLCQQERKLVGSFLILGVLLAHGEWEARKCVLCVYVWEGREVWNYRCAWLDSSMLLLHPHTNRQCYLSLVPRPLPSFLSLAVRLKGWPELTSLGPSWKKSLTIHDSVDVSGGQGACTYLYHHKCKNVFKRKQGMERLKSNQTR